MVQHLVPQKPGAPKPVPEAPRDRRARIMVIEDHPVFRDGLLWLLEQEPDFEVVWAAGSPADALAQAAALQPDVAIVDYYLGDLTGADVARQLRKVAPSVQVMALTACQDRAVVLDLLDAGALSYVLKGSEGPEIVRAIRATARGQSVLTGTVATTLLSQIQHSAATNGQARGTTAALYDGLTEREVEVLRLVCQGRSNREMGEALVISERTIENHLRNIYQKLHITDRVQAVLYAVRKGLVSPV